MDANQEAEIDAKIEVNDHLANASGSDLPTQIFPADVHELSDHFEHGLHVDASACDGPIKDTPTEYDEIELSVTESQYSAIVHPPEMNQILRIRAGPGSGKTFTLVARIAHLLSNGTPPESILVLSMANRSVDSLKDTLSRFIGSEKAAAVEISTFHSFCAGLLEQYGSIMNARYTKQNIFDETTWKTMIGFFSGKTVKFGQHTIEGSITPVRLSKALSSIMLGHVSVAAMAAEHKINPHYVSSLVEHLKSSGLIRYDELIADATRLIRYSAARLRDSEVGEETNSRVLLSRLANYKAVFVDEFQDVYPSLSSIVQSIVDYPTPGYEGKNKHLTITGDPNQSIYDFLGTNEKDMGLFHTKLPGMEVVDHQLLESFRCTQPILDAAVDVALKDPQLKLHATRTESHPQMPILLESRSALEEYHRVADEVVRLLCLSGGLVHLDDIAILTKTNDTAIAMQSVLKTRYGLPSYKLSSGNQWVASRLHILKQILGVIAGESSSNVSLMAILLTLDSETGGRKRVSKLFSESINKRSPGDMMFLETYLFGELSQAKDKTSTLSALYKKYPKVLERMAAFINQVQEERLILAETHASNPLLYNPAMLVSCLQRMANLDGISQFLKSDTHETSKATPLEILESFNDSIHHAYGKFSSKRDLQSTTFLDYFLQTYDSEVSSPVGNSIKVSTIHSAKGLEFPVVFILGQTLYAASWDKILQEEHAGKDMHKVANGPEHGRQTARGRNAGSLSFPEKDIVHENNSMQGPNSISRLLYVALSRARNLVYLGSRKPFEELSAITQARFTTTVPDLKPSAATCCGRASRRTETQGVISTDISQSSSGHGAEHRRRSDQVEQSSIFPGEDSPNPEMLASSLLNSIAEDVKRPIPARQKFDVGLDLFDSIMRKNAKLPVYYRKRGFANKTPEYPIIAGKRSPDALSSSLNRTANQSWHYAKSAIRRRAP